MAAGLVATEMIKLSQPSLPCSRSYSHPSFACRAGETRQYLLWISSQDFSMMPLASRELILPV